MKINKELLRFMSTYLANTEVWVSPDIEIPKDTGGFTFKRVKGVKGLVVFGDKYPLSNTDLSIEDHLSVWGSIKGTDALGMVFDIDASHRKNYIGRDGSSFFI